MSVSFASELVLVPRFGYFGKPNLITSPIPSKSSAAKTKGPTMVRGNFQPATKKKIDLKERKKVDQPL